MGRRGASASKDEERNHTDIRVTPGDAGKPERLERLEDLPMEISAEAVRKYKGIPLKKRRALVWRYKIRRWTNADLAQLFSIRERTIERDIRVIRETKWRDIQTDEDARKLLEEIYAELRLTDDEIVREAWQLYAKTNNDNVKVSCLKLIGERQSEIIKVMQSLGVITRAPEKLEVDSKAEVKIDDDLRKEIKELIRQRNRSSS